MQPSPPHGVLVVDKPEGLTSHDVVARVRRLLRTSAVGHAGTLDPMATGVLVLAVGQATKLVPWLSSADKAYEATVCFGAQTDTLDAHGLEVLHKAISDELRDALASSASGSVAPLLESALERERARVLQQPPAYSAIKTAGRRAYALARAGKAVDLEDRPVRVLSLSLAGCTVSPPAVSLQLDVTKGYYVRAMARDLAESLETAGTLTRLRRVRSGPFALVEASLLDDPDLAQRLQPIALAARRALPVGHLSAEGVAHARHGRPVPPRDLAAPADGPSAWLDDRERLVAVGSVDAEGLGHVLRGFAED